jgi:hypothetical protein
MAAAAPVLADRREARTMAHHALDEWLDRMEAEEGEAPTLLAISERFMETRLDLLAACLESVITTRYAADLQQTDAVCACGRVLRRRRFDAKTISTLHGQVTLHRPYFYFDGCATGFHPLNAKLQLSEKHHQYDIQDRSTRVGAELPFGVSQEPFERLTGVQASQHFLHETLNAVRRRDDARAGPARCRHDQPLDRRGPRRVPSASGTGGRVRRNARAHATGRRPHEETRTGSVAGSQGGAPLPARHGSSSGPRGELAPDRGQGSALGRLEVMAARIPRDRVRVALVGDGANWIWDAMLRHFPDGEQILDYFHCAEHVHETARAQFGDGTLEAQEWAEAALTRLCLNELGRTVGGLWRMRPRDAAAEESILKLTGYLEGQRERSVTTNSASVACRAAAAALNRPTS